MIYSVTYFNPLGNCDNTIHVSADNEVDAALIAHADFWVPDKEFNLSDYSVFEYDPDYVTSKEDVLKRGRWTDDLLNAAKEQALKEYVMEDWKYGYKKDGKDGLHYLMNDASEKFGPDMGPANTSALVYDILLKAGELEGLDK